MAKTVSVELPAEIFDVQTNVPLIHQVVVAQLAAARQGTHATKTRGEVRGGGRKPYRQKGTGRARQGSTRAPQFAGGGTVHGPQPRDYAQRTPKKMKVAALRGALSDRARHDRIHVIESLVTGTAPSTKDAAGALAGLTPRRNLLVVLERSDVTGAKSVRNLDHVHLLTVDQLNTYDVLCADDVVFTRGAYDTLVAHLPRGRRTESTPQVSAATDTDQAGTDEAGTDEAGFGPDSHGPTSDGAAPAGYDVKGNADSMKYHVPGSRWYDATEAEVWFTTPQAAEAAGFAPAGGAAAQAVTDGDDK